MVDVDPEAVERVAEEAGVEARRILPTRRQRVEVVLPGHLGMPVAAVLHLMRDRVATARVEGAVDGYAKHADADRAAHTRGGCRELGLGKLHRECVAPDRVRVAVVSVGGIAGRHRKDARRHRRQAVAGQHLAAGRLLRHDLAVLVVRAVDCNLCAGVPGLGAGVDPRAVPERPAAAVELRDTGVHRALHRARRGLLIADRQLREIDAPGSRSGRGRCAGGARRRIGDSVVASATGSNQRGAHDEGGECAPGHQRRRYSEPEGPAQAGRSGGVSEKRKTKHLFDGA